ncbi:MAG TPA: bifunctional folylpolyglutamate synthase/dihydrofolate synthase, partial [bacterium]|nr:bifunctional folylpolyglutamate synthase/dihydrofolate synthase [bacterium]
MPVLSDLFDSLLSLRSQNVELGLAAITRLLDRLDHPERDFPAVHVAGTNGKGSVCAMIAAQLMSAD